MKFYHQGNKSKSNNPDFASGCLLFIAFGGIIYLITLIDDLSTIKEHWWQILLAFLMGGSLLVSLFAKRAKLFNYHVSIKNEYFKIEKVSIPIKNIILDIYSRNDDFSRYHLRDLEGKIAIYSVIDDDLSKHFKDFFPEQTHYYQETSYKHDGPYISVLGEHTLAYNLDTGKYTINAGTQKEISFLPDVYSYDGKYKKGIALKKKS